MRTGTVNRKGCGSARKWIDSIRGCLAGAEAGAEQGYRAFEWYVVADKGVRHGATWIWNANH